MNTDAERSDAAEPTLLCDTCERPNAYLVPFFYFALGFIFAAPSLALKYYYAHVLRLQPATVSAIDGVVVLPWMIKPLFGLVSDTVPIGGRHRAPYVIASSLLCAVAWFALSGRGPWNKSAPLTVALLLVASVGVCFADVVVDTLLVAEARLERAGAHGKVQSGAWIVRHGGALLGSAVGAALVGSADVHTVFLATAVAPAVLFFVSWALHEPPAPPTPPTRIAASCTARLRARGASVRDALVRRGLWRMVLFVFVFAATPSSGSAFFFFLVNKIGFSRRFMSLLDVLDSVALLCGAVAYRFVFRHVPLRRMLIGAILASAALGCVQLVLILRLNERLGIDDHWFALSDDLVASFLSQLALMPLITAAARACPHGDEGTLYAGIVSVFNLASVASNFTGSYMTRRLHITQTNFDNMWLLSVACTLTSLLPLAFIGLVPDAGIATVAADKRAAA